MGRFLVPHVALAPMDRRLSRRRADRPVTGPDRSLNVSTRLLRRSGRISWIPTPARKEVASEPDAPASESMVAPGIHSPARRARIDLAEISVGGAICRTRGDVSGLPPHRGARVCWGSAIPGGSPDGWP